MSLRIPYLRKGAKNAAKEELLSPPERQKNKKASGLTSGGNSDYTAHDSIILVFTVAVEALFRGDGGYKYVRLLAVLPAESGFGK